MTRAQSTISLATIPLAAMLLTTLILGLTATPAIASDEVLGKWVAEVETRRGTNEIAMEFTVGDDGLAGSFTARDGVETLEDVAYSGETLTFKRITESGGGATALDYTATVDGDTMKVTVSTPRGERSFTAKRSG